ncbi:MAG TPA: cytidine deaminase [Planctomycetaceae bacterium]|nr:cytidine deaminase [Blastopirellula sp.]HAY78225.1 cytidine deaminase [Planctomycetaceae bacterium]
MDDDTLIQAAIAVRERAYAPYSNFRVGSALVTPDGQLFVGCNVENASYGLAICAERAAICAAVAAGHQQFAAVAVASSGGVSPCGACRQVLMEFGDMSVILVDVDQEHAVRRHALSELLPHGFSL